MTVVAAPVPELTIDKDVAGYSKGTFAGTPQGATGDTLTYTLTYTLVDGPVTSGVIEDELPVGVTYIDGTATSNAEFTFVGATAGVLRWEAASVTASGSVSYQATLSDTGEQPQPLVNVVTISSDQTQDDQADQAVYVAPPPEEATATPRITLPPTDALAPAGPAGTALPQLLLVLAGLMLLVLALTPGATRPTTRTAAAGGSHARHRPAVAAGIATRWSTHRGPTSGLPRPRARHPSGCLARVRVRVRRPWRPRAALGRPRRAQPRGARGRPIYDRASCYPGRWPSTPSPTRGCRRFGRPAPSPRGRERPADRRFVPVVGTGIAERGSPSAATGQRATGATDDAARPVAPGRGRPHEQAPSWVEGRLV